MSDDRGYTAGNSVPDAGTPPPAPAGAPDSSNVGADQNTGIGSGGSTPAPVAPQTAAPQAPPTVDVGTIHKSLFGKVFEGLGGGPQRVSVTDPNTGLTHVELRHQTNGQIMKSVLAGAITGMLAGMSTPNQVMDTAQGPVETNQPMQAAAAGGQAVAKQREDVQKAAQAEQDRKYSMYYTTLNNNLHLHANQLNNSKLEWEMNQQAISEAKPILDAMQNYEVAYGKQIIKARGVRAQDLMPKYHVAMDSALPDGRIPVMGKDGKQEKNPDGTPKFEVTYAVFDPSAMAQMSDELKNTAFAKSNPALQQLPANSAVAARVLVDTFNKSQSYGIAEKVLDNMVQRAAQMQDQKAPAHLKMDELIKKDPYLVQAIPFIGKYAGLDPDVALDQMEKDHPEMVGHIAGILGINRSELAEAREGDKAAAKRNAQLLSGPMTADIAETILSDPESSPVLKARAQAWQLLDEQRKEREKKNQTAADQAERQGDPDVAAKLLRDGTLTLSELKARAVTPKFITEVVDKAKQMAAAEGEPQWTPQYQESQFNVAKSPQNVQFFGSANSLLDKSGTLDQLAQQAGKLHNFKIPKFNEWKNYLEYNVGDPALAGFYQTLIGVADDYAKVMGGGTGSDTSRLQVMQSFANKHNPAQMAEAISAARHAVQSQVSARIGKNKVMQQMYGSNVPDRTATPPQGGAQGGGKLYQPGQVLKAKDGSFIQLQQNGQWTPYQPTQQ